MRIMYGQTACSGQYQQRFCSGQASDEHNMSPADGTPFFSEKGKMYGYGYSSGKQEAYSQGVINDAGKADGHNDENHVQIA